MRRCIRPLTGPPLRSRRAYLLIDVLTGMFILAALVLSLMAIIAAQGRAVRKLADTRAAVRLAEHALAELQSGRAAQADGEETQLEVKRLEPPPSIGGAWVQVRATVRGQSTTLFGLLPSPYGSE